MSYKPERALTRIHLASLRAEIPEVEMSYKPERALTHNILSCKYLRKPTVEMSYKPERALTHLKTILIIEVNV